MINKGGQPINDEQIDLESWSASFADAPDQDYAEWMHASEDEADTGVTPGEVDEWIRMQEEASAAPMPSIGAMLIAAKEKLTKKPTNLHGYLAGHPLGEFFNQVSQSNQIPPDSVTVIGLASLSAACCMTYKVKAPWGEYLPTGLYAAAEQPPSTRKSGTIRMFTNPIRAALKHVNAGRTAARQDKEMQLADTAKEAAQDRMRIKKEMAQLPKPIIGFISDATPEAIDAKVLIPNGGFFNLSSSEQTAVDTAFGLSYGDKSKTPNMAFLLEGYDGGHITGLRAGRDSFDGQVYGSCAFFAQPGVIDKILQKSGGSGMVERFMMVSEDSWLGFRDFDAPAPDSNNYVRMISNLMQFVPARGGFEYLNELEFNVEGAQMINGYARAIEPSLGENGRFSANEMRGFAGKATTMATKIAAVLHLVSHYSTHSERTSRIIHPAWVAMGISLTDALMENYFSMLTKKGAIGQDAEEAEVLDFLTNDKRGMPQFLAQTKRTLRMRKVFSGNQKRVTEVIDKLVEAGILMLTGEGKTRKLALNPRHGSK